MSRNTLGEALIVIVTLAGFFTALILGKLSLSDIGLIAAFLGLLVAFYFALLVARMLFFWMTGGDRSPGEIPWWAQHEMHHKQTRVVAEKKK